jgi:hypothetical protein
MVNRVGEGIYVRVRLTHRWNEWMGDLAESTS